MSYADLSSAECSTLLDEQKRAYAAWKAKDLSLNMARGKPSSAQLDLSAPMLDVLNAESDLKAADGTDCRNYGVGVGIREARELMATMLDDEADRVIVGGESSLNLMYDAIARNWAFGTQGCTPWGKLDTVKWICPVPGYDRHFSITELFGIEMINVPLNEDGPDMDAVEQLAADESVKGIWCVPTYSNPSGCTYSDEVVERLANMKAADDFRIFWDNAYCVHHLSSNPAEQEHVADIARACAAAGNPNRAYKFASTSKITFPGAGIAAMASSEANIAEITKLMNVQIIGHDKLNQLRHVRFLRDAEGIAEHMAKHAALLRPKFDLVEETLSRELEGTGCTWTHPRGGYFVTFTGPQGTAKRIVELAREAGVTLTGAGAPFPYHKDPSDAVIRIAPSLPPVEELAQALEVFCCCVKIAALEKLV
ncbi:aminotransferase class I/II-fold pyridoxal phosphate-dependent enzyme [Denitrobacterium detoxificans]|jgi:aspartate/methionine/tyrosine aminotransferase|uniref:aminotransferase class I/II-fold pyridoxal phosphate-dependent enzyme n=1 Tax=Denitrobacterium detoxificans TaxID=79604 RepID=UPI0026EBF314|nr:aminotransferase class I/II-fold pyridoxal phosphate-dependent enzyme [Denitrobacterium detoxificans]MBE6465841.1 aminotransferase class I/II-fold pyridoxal phosphate-dependent enzyme [Denitrobacterium detoxificans]